MERTVWILALVLAVVASVGCKDSTPNYISFDAQSPAQTADARTDLPPSDDAAAHGTVDASASDDGESGQ